MTNQVSQVQYSFQQVTAVSKKYTQKQSIQTP